MRHLDAVRTITFPPQPRDRVVEHARRKLRGEYLPEEETAKKSYGLLGGRVQGSDVLVTHAFPLRRNLRWSPQLQPYIDEVMDEVAVASETPFQRRGWVTDPREVRAAEQTCDAAGSTLFGSYHMHRVAWSHDPVRDTCTQLDRRLAEGSGLWCLILSMVDPQRPVLRAFYEGRNEQEALVRQSIPIDSANGR